jgi:hypothetical protein
MPHCPLKPTPGRPGALPRHRARPPRALGEPGRASAAHAQTKLLEPICVTGAPLRATRGNHPGHCRDQGAGPPWLTSQAARLLPEPISAPCQAAIKLQCAHTQCWLRWYRRAARRPRGPSGGHASPAAAARSAPHAPHMDAMSGRACSTRMAPPARAPPSSTPRAAWLLQRAADAVRARRARVLTRAGWLSGTYPACCIAQSARHPASIYCVDSPELGFHRLLVGLQSYSRDRGCHAADLLSLRLTLS